jgi:threonine synthase
MSTDLRYELRCRECQTRWGNQPISFCQICFAPLEVAYDWDRIRKEINKDKISNRATNLWRYKELLPLPEDFDNALRREADHAPSGAVGGANGNMKKQRSAAGWSEATGIYEASTRPDLRPC